ncbi:MAG: N-acetylmuramoyl-L-alanine amidase [Acidobacteria bacterium]|nr:N-acetylmuramoyl-L-alanine amidase [Acidobacteriota bacterium]
MIADRRRTRRAARAAALAALLAVAVVLCLAAPAAAQPGPAARRIQTVVIDPGHGGTESGAKGRFGNLEKDVTLAIALKLKALVERGMGSEVVLTRDRDVDVSLENRSAIANNHKAGLFISLHANGAVQKKAAGSETFFLSLNATDEETRRLAYLENNGSDLQSHIDPSSDDDLMMILWDMAQNAYVKESGRLAEYVQIELDAMLGLRNRGIKQAPFKILRGVACPAILVEAAFLSNPDEEQKLASEDYQARIAEAVYRGLTRFLRLPE